MYCMYRVSYDCFGSRFTGKLQTQHEHSLYIGIQYCVKFCIDLGTKACAVQKSVSTELHTMTKQMMNITGQTKYYLFSAIWSTIKSTLTFHVL